jgi:hypothetical protein
MARLGIGILVIPQKEWAEHAAELAEYNQIFRDMHGVAAPRPYIGGWVACDKDAGKAEEMARTYISGYWQSVVKHYEMFGDHFQNTKGYEYYKRLPEAISEVGVDGMAEFFMSLQVWGTPEMCYEKIKDIHEKTDCCGFTGVFSYAGMSHAMARGNMELFAREVMPQLRTLGHSPVFDMEEDGTPEFAAAGA